MKEMIAQLLPDPGYLLLYLDEDGEELTDTYHESLEKALDQANWEFNIEPDEWDPQPPPACNKQFY
jgi:hypothetical protein